MAFPIHSFLSLLPPKVLLGTVLLGALGGGWLSTVQAAPLLNELNPSPLAPAAQIAQNNETVSTYCYWSTLQMGVYEEPNTQSTAIGVLPAGAIVFIGPGSGQGWVRLQSPVIGWMTTAGLKANPLQGCNGLGSIVPVEESTNNTSRPAKTPTTSLATPSTEPVLCTVVSPSGLAVRNQPILHPRTLTAILEPGLHRFQFSDRQVQLESFNQVRDWVYITAPVTGWISPRVVGNPTPELSGQGCL